MRKRYYIMLVARGADGELLKVPIPLHYMYTFLVGAVIGMLTITGMAGSYTRMLLKTSRFNELRIEKEALKKNYRQLEEVAQDKELQVASLAPLASEVSTIYGLKTDHLQRTAALDDSDHERYIQSLDQLYSLKKTALSGVAATVVTSGLNAPHMTMGDWVRLSSAPNLWPVEGRITDAFGERIDPFNGEGAFHTGIDISAEVGHPIIAPADGQVRLSEFVKGYGRAVIIDHGNGITTLYGHLSQFAVHDDQFVRRGQVIGYVGDSGRSTGPHLHYEVRLHDAPVNPYKFMRSTMARLSFSVVGGS
ncbi:MAG TPA: peptidoglycan DD-metalloendopeptidase family protein [Terriglobales bacterium]